MSSAGQILSLDEQGTYYIDGKRVTREKWARHRKEREAEFIKWIEAHGSSFVAAWECAHSEAPCELCRRANQKQRDVLDREGARLKAAERVQLASVRS